MADSLTEKNPLRYSMAQRRDIKIGGKKKAD